MITPDVGGGFGMKAFFYPEYTMAAFAARGIGPAGEVDRRARRELSCPTRWAATTSRRPRSPSTPTTASWACKVDLIANMGAYYFAYAPYIPTGAALKVLPGVYDVKVLSYGVKGVFTNTVPVDAYRGAGRPESIYCIERVMDYAARPAGRRSGRAAAQELHPARSRCRSRPRPASSTTPASSPRSWTPACKKADWSGIAGAQGRRRRAKGKLRGIGMCYYIESTMGDPTEHAAIEFADGRHRQRAGRAPRPTARATRRPTPRSCTAG